MNYDGPERRAQDQRISRIEQELDSIVKLMEDDRKDRHEFRNKFDLMLFGDGDSKKGLFTRTVELENAHKAHARLAWTGITVAMGLGVTSFWNLITGKSH